MKKILIALLTVVLLFQAASCGGNGDITSDNEQVSDTKSDKASKTESVEEDKNKLVFINEDKTDYVIVYDGTDDNIKDAAERIKEHITLKTGTEIKCEPVKNVKEPYEHEIVIGDIRDGVKPIKEKLKETGDFAIYRSGDDLVVYATEGSNYPYVAEMFVEAVLSAYTYNGHQLVLCNDTDYIHSESKYADTSYFDYYSQKRGMSEEFIYSMMETRTANFVGANGQMPYVLYVPMDYNPEKKYPVLLFLHGAGERGSSGDIATLTANVIKDAFKQQGTPLEEVIIVMPQCPITTQWVNTPWSDGNYSTGNVEESAAVKTAFKIFKDVTSEFSTDPDRYYVSGVSMGGFGTWDMLIRHTDTFAAGMPICGGGDASQAKKLKNVPIYTIHGDADGIVPVDGTREMVNAIKNAGGTKITYYEVAGAGHDVWTIPGTDMKYFNWLFSQKLSDRK